VPGRCAEEARDAQQCARGHIKVAMLLLRLRCFAGAPLEQANRRAWR
jgi:hypothetical protein